MNRKQRRAREKELKKLSDAERNLSEKIFLFEKLEQECLACEKPFDKTNREMVESWNVVVREDKEPPVRLYCPECWEMAQKIAAEYMKKEKK